MDPIFCLDIYELASKVQFFNKTSPMQGIGYFQNLRNFLDFLGGIFQQNLFWGFFWRFFGGVFVWEEFFGGIFLEDFLGRIFLGGFFWEDFFGRIFWEDFLGGFFWEEFFGRNYLVEFYKELMFLSRFWGNFVSMQGRRKDF